MSVDQPHSSLSSESITVTGNELLLLPRPSSLICPRSLAIYANTHPQCKYHIKKDHGGSFPLRGWVCFRDL